MHFQVNPLQSTKHFVAPADWHNVVLLPSKLSALKSPQNQACSACKHLLHCLLACCKTDAKQCGGAWAAPGWPLLRGVSSCKVLSLLCLLLQTFMFAVFDDASESVQNATGPIDDGYIANAVGSLPGDPFCCAGPEPEMDGGMFQ